MNGPSGSPVLPPLDILLTSSLASAAEDIIPSAPASTRYHVGEERWQRSGSIAGASTSSRIAGMPPLLGGPVGQGGWGLRGMDGVAMIGCAVAKNQRKKTPQYVVRMCSCSIVV